MNTQKLFFIQKICQHQEKSLTLHSQKERAGCSSARLEYTSGGRVVVRSNRITPTSSKSLESQ